MSYVPAGGGGSVSSTSGSGIVVSGGSVLSSGLVAGSNITLTPDSSFGGKGLRIDSSGGGGGGLASVTSSNGSGINVAQVGQNANLTSALAAGTGIALTPSGVAKTLTINNTQTVASAGAGSGINATVVGNQTNISTNLIAGSNIALTPSALNSSINVGLKPNVVIPVNGSLAVNEAALNNTQSAMEVADAPTGYFYVRNGTSGTPGQIGYYNQAQGYDNWFMNKTGNLACATASANTAFILNNSVLQNPNDGMELYDAPNSYLYFNKSNGYLGHFIQNGGPDWSMTPTGGLSCDTVNATTSMTTPGQLTVRNIVNSLPPVGFGDILSLTDSANSYYIQYNDSGSLGGWNTSPSAPVWSINKTGVISAPSSTINTMSSSSLALTPGNCSLSSSAGSNRIQVATPGGGQVLAYTSDIPAIPATPSLNAVTAIGNDCNGAGGIVLDAGPGTSIRLSSPGPNQFVVGTTTPGGAFTTTFTSGALQANSMEFLQDDVTLTSSSGGGKRLYVQGGPTTQTVAYLSDITGGGGGVQSVTAGSANIVIAGTATNPTVNLATNPNIAGTLTVSGTTPNYFNAGIYAPGLVVNNNFTGPGNLGIALTSPSSNVGTFVSQDGSSPCQVRVIGTAQITSASSGGSTATLSSSNGNLNINNVRALVQTTGANYLGIQNVTVAGGSTATLTAANFGQTIVYKFSSSGTLTVVLPNISSGTVPLGSFINICNQLNDTVTGTSIVVSQSIGSPTTNATFTNKNQMMTFVLTGYSSTTPMYHCIGA